MQVTENLTKKYQTLTSQSAIRLYYDILYKYGLFTPPTNQQLTKDLMTDLEIFAAFPEEIRADKDVALLYMTAWHNYFYLNEELQKDSSIIENYLSHDDFSPSLGYHTLPGEILHNEELVRKLLYHYPWHRLAPIQKLTFAGRILSDEKLMWRSCLGNDFNFGDIADSLKNNKEFVLKVLRDCGGAITYDRMKTFTDHIPAALKDDMDVAKAVIHLDAQSYSYFLSDRLKADKSIALYALQQGADSTTLQYVFMDDVRFAKLYVTENFNIYLKLNDAIKAEADIALAAVNNYIEAVKPFISEDRQFYYDCMYVFPPHINLLGFISEDVLYNEQILAAIVAGYNDIVDFIYREAKLHSKQRLLDQVKGLPRSLSVLSDHKHFIISSFNQLREVLVRNQGA